MIRMRSSMMAALIASILAKQLAYYAREGFVTNVSFQVGN